MDQLFGYTGTMRFLTLNCQRGHHADLFARLGEFLKRALDAREYDALLLQEVNPKVLSLLQHPSYKTIRVFDEEAGQESELCIIYRSSYSIVSTGFQSFAPLQYRKHNGGFQCPTFGVLWADIDTGAEVVRLVSIHLHSDTDRHLRLRELRLAKELFTDLRKPTIVAGDFNSVFPGETARNAQVLAPEFSWVTTRWVPTLDSRYCDNEPSLLTRVMSFLGQFNIGISFHADHVFMSQKMVDGYLVECRMITDRVSDHSPIAFLLTKRAGNAP